VPAVQVRRACGAIIRQSRGQVPGSLRLHDHRRHMVGHDVVEVWVSSAIRRHRSDSTILVARIHDPRPHSEPAPDRTSRTRPAARPRPTRGTGTREPCTPRRTNRSAVGVPPLQPRCHREQGDRERRARDRVVAAQLVDREDPSSPAACGSGPSGPRRSRPMPARPGRAPR
jgi:hypothetical protein